MTNIVKNPDYINWLKKIKSKIYNAQIKAALAASRELIFFYWELGESIAKELEKNTWGNKVIDQLSKDLSVEFPSLQGFSRTNLYYIKKFYDYFNTFDEKLVIVPQAEGQSKPAIVSEIIWKLPWGHIKIILDKIKDPKVALFYIKETIENSWSRDTLALQIKSELYKRQGKAITNFKQTLPEPQSDLAQQTLKDPYSFDFLTLTKPYNEREIENQLINNITKFLLELGKGFAFIGRQYHLEIDNNDYYLDLLFYHTHLNCYVVVELKNTKFIPEYAGKLNFYLSAVDSLLKQDKDNPTIGILLCRDKTKIETEFALRDINKPIGVSEFNLTEILPEKLKNSLPTVEEIENELTIEENE